MPLRILLRPLSTKREQYLNEFGQNTCLPKEFIERVSVSEDISKSECFDRPLLVLWDHLWSPCAKRGRGAEYRTCTPATRHILPVTSGLASRLAATRCFTCGFFSSTQTGTNKYKYIGPPSDRDGNVLASATGQPPCLLRSSPDALREGGAYLARTRLGDEPPIAQARNRQAMDVPVLSKCRCGRHSTMALLH